MCSAAGVVDVIRRKCPQSDGGTLVPCLSGIAG
jgi:hypothetical protein